MTIINWELKGMKPRYPEKVLKKFSELWATLKRS